tara:strand:- start:1922 stop:2614 length:693 start_codon:yes stop_codon:yes gene_type:complete
MSCINIKLCNTINQIADNVSHSLPLLPAKIVSAPIKIHKTYTDNGEELDEDKMCEIILKYKDCYDFHTLPKPMFFYQRYPQYYRRDTTDISLEVFLKILETGDEYKKCETREARRIFMRNEVVKSICEFYDAYGYLPNYEEEFTKGTDYELFRTDKDNIQIIDEQDEDTEELELEGLDEPALDLSESDYERERYDDPAVMYNISPSNSPASAPSIMFEADDLDKVGLYGT